jgi:Family of unknown function (DUF6461)
MAQEPDSDLGWFTVWVERRLGLGLTFARGLPRERLLESFDLRPGVPAAVETFDEAEADADPDRPKVRVGEHDGWAYAVEHFTVRGARPETLARLSAGGGEAFALWYTAKAFCGVLYAADGELVSGFDLVATNLRWGRDPHRFDTEMAQAGFLGPPEARTPALGARFVRLAFGITLDRQLLQRPLPSYELGPAAPAPLPPAVRDPAAWPPRARPIGTSAPPSSPRVPLRVTPAPQPQPRGTVTRPPTVPPDGSD